MKFISLIATLSVLHLNITTSQYPKYECFRFESNRCMPFGYKYVRKWINDSVFADMRIGEKCFYSDDTFIVSNNTWSYVRRGKIFPYFSPARFSAKDSIVYYQTIDNIYQGKIYGRKEVFYPLREDTVNRKRVFVYRGDEREIYFDPALGIVREDYRLVCVRLLSKDIMLDKFVSYPLCP